MIQITRPVAASKKWLRISGGRILVPPSRPCRMPPRESQIDSRMKPPPAVRTHAISAAHSIRSTSLRVMRAYPGRHVRILLGGGFEGVLAVPAVRDRRAAVPPERLRRQAHSRRPLTPLVLRPVDELDGAF